MVSATSLPGVTAIAVSTGVVLCAVWYWGKYKKKREESLARIDELIGTTTTTADVSPTPHTAQYRVLTQRVKPEMSRIHPSLPNPDGITLIYHHTTDEPSSCIHVPLIIDGPRITTAVWGEEARGVDQGDAVAEWLSRHLGIIGARLIKSVSTQEFMRSLPPKKGGRGNDGLDFQDGFPLLVLSRASAAELIAHVPIGVGRQMDYRRFRPNILLDGCPPYSEEKFPTLELVEGLTTLDLIRPCSRCTIPTVDPDTGMMDTQTKEPLSTLFDFRTGRSVSFNIIQIDNE
ncbi:molybdopterin cofactor sulfurase, putative [Perkinsus marinus ATCC 50983]|uniref:Molybdopterin cofactor sulfurase, putative n=1 Tax=Perkinsus marinus (strain ATCC 50983 / TXsc) TaxID=423536 RepID=C5LUY1_PERM5|nr:molybdopterin cofactor sulfurase, putative [Perkinsus marinus ATCC 50983]EEQ99481.1 molybdopterin cofactor sulfurase, putative [Perkinsus marinus ATCC 50983]|eukprot:XP_002766764.1 molybdopterin cofactor sulfurase, putative [Perkinsus marinus ATCC 50983]